MATRRTYLKAVVSAVISAIIAFLSSLATSLQGPTAASSGFDSITASQWITAVLAFFVALGLTGGATFRVPNADAGGGTVALARPQPAPASSGRGDDAGRDAS